MVPINAQQLTKIGEEEEHWKQKHITEGHKRPGTKKQTQRTGGGENRREKRRERIRTKHKKKTVQRGEEEGTEGEKNKSRRNNTEFSSKERLHQSSLKTIAASV